MRSNVFSWSFLGWVREGREGVVEGRWRVGGGFSLLDMLVCFVCLPNQPVNFKLKKSASNLYLNFKVHTNDVTDFPCCKVDVEFLYKGTI